MSKPHNSKTCIIICKEAMVEVAKYQGILAHDLVRQLAIARAAVIVANMDDSIDAGTRIYRLEESIEEINRQFTYLEEMAATAATR